MRVMVMIFGNEQSEGGNLPSEEVLTAMGNYNEELVKAGIMLGGEGLHPSSKGRRVRVTRGKTTIVDGPFAESKELIAGYWIWRVSSLEEATEWVRKIPNPTGEDYQIEIRPLHETEDFGAEFTPEARAQEERLRETIAKRTGAKA